MDQHQQATRLPDWNQVLVVIAHPDDESFGLGAIIDTFTSSGAAVQILCLTHGEASTLGGEIDDLGTQRKQELENASRILGVAGTKLLNWPDGALAHADVDAVVADIRAAISEHSPDGLLVFEPHGVSGHPDHAAATARALDAVAGSPLPVLAWTVPEEVATQLNAEVGALIHGERAENIDILLPVDRANQRDAINAHESQVVPGGILRRRLELMGDQEALRWLQGPAS
ncbi:MAG TPA: PIG-L family deacetylase [Marmoricola sp.]|nr:PIG-L family deacetylase [Marmoricola sp.]HNI70239.1 PIG-L family deacetylase [Marmoricola sp.]